MKLKTLFSTMLLTVTFVASSAVAHASLSFSPRGVYLSSPRPNGLAFCQNFLNKLSEVCHKNLGENSLCDDQATLDSIIRSDIDTEGGVAAFCKESPRFDTCVKIFSYYMNYCPKLKKTS